MSDDSKDGSEKDRNAPTVRDLRGPSPVSADTIPDLIGQYSPPRRPPEASHHRTIDLKPVRLSDEADPRRWRTERRLVSPERPAKRPGSLWVAALVLLAIGAWALVWVSAALEKTKPAVVVSPPAPAAVAAPTASARAPDRTEAPTAPASPIAPANPAPRQNADGPTPDAPKSESTLPKPTRPRESAKKRKDPWLE